MITAKWNKKIDSIYKKIDKFKIQCMTGQVQAVRESTFLIHSIAVRSLQTTSAGHPAIRYKPKRTVVVSAPGDAPNTDTGRAVQSIKFDFQDSGLRGRIGTNLRYLRDLEFGTKRIAPRPWLSSAVSEASKDVKQIFDKIFKRTIKEVEE